MAGGYWSQVKGSAVVAFQALLVSGICSLLSFFMATVPPVFFFVYIIIWGIAVTADSPQFSTLTAQTAPPAVKGTAMTAVICIGFIISIVSIQILNYLFHHFHHPAVFVLLGIGPLLGVKACYRLLKAAR
jgi:MFS family permease